MKFFLAIVLFCIVYIEVRAEIFVADPSIVLYGDTYYLCGTMDSKGNEHPFVIYKSEDLKNWSSFDAYGREYTALKEGASFAGRRFVAPQMFRRGDKYYFAYSEYLMAIAQSDTPLGPYSQKNPAAIKADSKQIDPFVFLDDDGKAYIYFSSQQPEGCCIAVAELNDSFDRFVPYTFKVVLRASEDWENVKNRKTPTAEGPTVLKRGGKYVMFYSANDYRDAEYAVGIAVADSPFGPWKKSSANPIIRGDMINRKGAGHGDAFLDKDGRIWYVFHTHNSNEKVEPRRTAIVRLKESFSDGVPAYEAQWDSFRFL